MTLKLKGKTREEATRLMGLFRNLVTSPEGSAERPRELGDLNVLGGVSKFPQRVKCAMLAWRAFEQALQETTPGGTETEVSTEDQED